MSQRQFYRLAPTLGRISSLTAGSLTIGVPAGRRIRLGRVKHLTVRIFPNREGELCFPSGTQFPNLEALNLEIAQDGLIYRERLMSYFPRLIKLTLVLYNEQVSWVEIALSFISPSLEHMIIRDYIQSTELGITSLSDVTYCAPIKVNICASTSQRLLDLIHRLTFSKVLELHLECNAEVEDVGLEAFQLPSLHKLVLRGPHAHHILCYIVAPSLATVTVELQSHFPHLGMWSFPSCLQPSFPGVRNVTMWLPDYSSSNHPLEAFPNVIDLTLIAKPETSALRWLEMRRNEGLGLDVSSTLVRSYELGKLHVQVNHLWSGDFSVDSLEHQMRRVIKSRSEYGSPLEVASYKYKRKFKEMI